jgi:hypothetical protein
MEVLYQLSHRSRSPWAFPCFDGSDRGNQRDVLRKLLWTGLYAGIAAGATVAARTLASRIWRVATGEEPPVKK